MSRFLNLEHFFDFSQKLNEFDFKLNNWMILSRKVQKSWRTCPEKIFSHVKISLD
jgi:hypothetical protein